MSDSSDRNYTRNSKPSREGKGDLKGLIHSGLDDYAVISKLRKEHPNDEDFVNKMFEAYKERMDFIRRKAGKFKTLIFSKYANLPLPQVLEKAKKFKRKYEFDDAEFNSFVNMVLSDKTFSANTLNLPTGSMSRTLGYNFDALVGDRLRVKNNEMDVLQEILRLHAETKALHSQIVIQSLTYVDCAPEALTGDFDRKKHNPYSYIHPVVAALFLPRIRYIDEHLLIANVANIVKCRHESKPIQTQPEFELYWDLITDPNEVACVTNKDAPMVDLRNRVILQTKLWESVLSLRQGNYYNQGLSDIMVALDNCNNNIFDAPDFAYVKDEGTILRRLLGAFSLRPTIVSVRPYYGIAAGNYSMNSMAMVQVTTIPIVTLRLPLNIQNKNVSIHLNEALEQLQWYVENKMIVPKSQSIVYSRDVLFFYANRRYQSINFGSLNAPFNFTSLPATVTGFETINTCNINYQSRINVGDDYFELRSVVLVERSHVNKDLIIGSTAAIVVPSDYSLGRIDKTYLLYDPQGAGEQFEYGKQFVSNRPITTIPGMTPYHATSIGGVESFDRRAQSRGTIFVYVKENSQQTKIRPN
jgi:hypothetical protein